MNQADPRGHYARLGVAPTAPASVIRAAYRALAMEQHPDRDKDEGATKRFQDLQRAFDVLSDPKMRAEYDALAEPVEQKRAKQADHPSRNPERPATTTPKYEAVRCDTCANITASPRYRVFYKVFAYLLGATRRPVQGIYCAQCEMKVGAKCTGITLVTGWWSLHGFVWTLDSLRQNLFGANGFEEQNARLPAKQAAYFVSTGNLPLALAIAHEAHATALRFRDPNTKASAIRAKLGYAQNDPLKELRESLAAYIRANDAGGAAPKLRNRAGMFSSAFQVQAAMVGALGTALALWGVVEYRNGVEEENYRRYQAEVAQQNAAVEQKRAAAARLEAAAEAAAVAKRQAVALAANLRPLPASGEYGSLPWRQYGSDNQPPFKVIATSDTNYLIKLTDWTSDAPVASLFVRAGEEAQIGIPPGSYRVKVASGQKWYGEVLRFGPDTNYSKVESPMSFRIEGNQLLGRSLQMQLVTHGNLRREPIKAADF